MALLRLAVKENASAPKKRSQRAEATAKRKRAQDAEDTKWSAMQVKWAQQDVVDNDKLRSLKAQLERCEKAKLDLGSGIKARIVPEESIPALVSLIASVRVCVVFLSLSHLSSRSLLYIYICHTTFCLRFSLLTLVHQQIFLFFTHTHTRTHTHTHTHTHTYASRLVQ